jgi:hypothetical protein
MVSGGLQSGLHVDSRGLFRPAARFGNPGPVPVLSGRRSAGTGASARGSLPDFGEAAFPVVTVLVLAIVASAQITMTVPPRDLPDPSLTPGLIRTSDAVEICAPGFTTELHRHTTEETKKKVCQEYHVQPCPREHQMEIDHVVPLELGGEDEIGNLWVQMAPAFHEKDKLENKLHKLVCSNQMTLPAAQSCIMTNWITCYEKIFSAVPLGVHTTGEDHE